MAKIIGIPGYRYEMSSFGSGLNHLEYISSFGNARIIMPWEEFVDVDMLYLPGGLDINPRSYGEVPSFKTSNTDVFKQFFYDERLPNYVGRVPIFGVCLGMQQLAVYFGSKLTQDLKFHEQSSSRWGDAHKVIPTVRYLENKNVKNGMNVNSHHHQCVTLSNLGKDLISTHLCDNFDNFQDPIVESFQHRTLPIAGVQWHPEELYDEYSTRIINRLLNN